MKCEGEAGQAGDAGEALALVHVSVLSSGGTDMWRLWLKFR